MNAGCWEPEEGDPGSREIVGEGDNSDGAVGESAPS